MWTETDGAGSPDMGPHHLWILVLTLFFSFLFLILIYFWLCWVFIAVHGLSLVAMGGGYSLIAVHVLLIAVTSLVAEHGF